MHAPTPSAPPAADRIRLDPIVDPPYPNGFIFNGYGGWNGWPEVIRLRNGDLYIAFCAGYDHASFRTPLDAHPDHVAEFKRKFQTMGAPMQAWTFDWDCPTGGQIMWMRSRDNGGDLRPGRTDRPAAGADGHRLEPASASDRRPGGNGSLRGRS